MALAQIIDLDEVRRARRAAPATVAAAAMSMPLSSAADHLPMWCCYWVPVMYWYVP
jgi:hypothetical protein